jgi:hypothetical protein
MTERKPPGVPTGNWVDELIKAAQARGEFDNLPGAGKPLPDIDSTDEDWWIRRKLRDEGLSSDVLLPPALALRRELAQRGETTRTLHSEADVRAHVAELNHRVAEWIRFPTGPALPVIPADPDQVVADWRAARGVPAPTTEPTPAGPSPLAGETADGETGRGPARRRRWWRFWRTRG